MKVNACTGFTFFEFSDLSLQLLDIITLSNSPPLLLHRLIWLIQILYLLCSDPGKFAELVPITQTNKQALS